MSNKEVKKTSIGGQAVMEGVMMRGPHKMAVAVRKSDGEIVMKVDDNGTTKKSKILKLPILRGCINFFSSLIIGIKALMYSAEFIDLEEDEEAESKFEKWLDTKFGDKVKDIVIYFSIALSLVLSIGLFIVLPTLVASGINYLCSGELFSVPQWLKNTAESRVFYNVIEAVVKMSIFLTYMALVSKMKEIKRVFEYHGAEHKTIACYEAGEELTVENVKKHTRFHPRCGTNFLLFVMVISIVLFALLPKFDGDVVGILLRIGTRLALMPVVAGLSYEVIKLAGKCKNKCVGIFTKPGLWLQRLTTREPDENQIEVAIKSMQAVIPENGEDDLW